MESVVPELEKIMPAPTSSNLKPDTLLKFVPTTLPSAAHQISLEEEVLNDSGFHDSTPLTVSLTDEPDLPVIQLLEQTIPDQVDNPAVPDESDSNIAQSIVPEQDRSIPKSNSSDLTNDSPIQKVINNDVLSGVKLAATVSQKFAPTVLPNTAHQTSSGEKVLNDGGVHDSIPLTVPSADEPDLRVIQHLEINIPEHIDIADPDEQTSQRPRTDSETLLDSSTVVDEFFSSGSTDHKHEQSSRDDNDSLSPFDFNTSAQDSEKTYFGKNPDRVQAEDDQSHSLASKEVCCINDFSTFGGRDMETPINNFLTALCFSILVMKPLYFQS